MTERLQFGFHGFLNALPLLNPLANTLQGEFDMVVDAPCAIAEKMTAGKLDLAMIPSIEYLRAADRFKLWPEICIASKGAVLTVLLISKKPIGEIRDIALDNRSRTSVALLKLLFGAQFRKDIRYEAIAPEINSMLSAHDAALVIGDPALKYTASENLQVYDLSQEWFVRTGKAFVHAVIAVRNDIELSDSLKNTLRRTLQNVPAEIGLVVATEAANYKPGVCEDYLRNKIRYTLGEEELQGLSCFQEMCFASGILEQRYPINFV